MTDIMKHLKFIRFFILILFVLLNVFQAHAGYKIPVVSLLLLFSLIITNDVMRNNMKRKNSIYYCSLILSLIGAAILKYFVSDFITTLYMFFNVIEILYIAHRIRYLFLSLHFILYLIIVESNIRELGITEQLTTIGTDFLIYFSVIYALYLSHTVRKKREETDRLTEELKSSYVKLKDYSLKVEELSIARERQRVAQELHDSLGHSLMALAMYLDFAEKIFDSNPEKAKDVIAKARDISRSSTANLRMAVNTLKEERNVDDLKNAINELIDSFKILDNINIDFNMDKRLEELNPDIKLCLYKTIRESLTNGIKHGKATNFHLDLFIDSNNVELIIRDNGLGCDSIVKSNGLKGIEDRVSALGGTVDFSSQQNCGFLIKTIIPIYEETMQE